MQMSPLPANEEERIADLESYGLLDTPFERVFDQIATLAAKICNAPFAMITLIDRNRQWVKAMHGLTGPRENSRDISFCSYTILSDEVLHVPDARADNRFVDNPFVIGTPQIRLYAGAPLTSVKGNKLGSLCVISNEARALSQTQLESLRQLSEVVTALFEAHKQQSKLAVLGKIMDEVQDEIILTDAKTLRCLYANRAALNNLELTDEDVQSGKIPLTRILKASNDSTQRFEALLKGEADQLLLEVSSSSNPNERAYEFHFQRLNMSNALIASIGRDITERKRLEEEQAILQRDLREQHACLEETHAQLNHELEAARITQLQFMPKPNKFNQLRFDWLFEASSFVAGDIFDYFPLDDQFTCFYVADVSGHGISSALLSFSLQRQIASTREQMQNVLARLHGNVGEAARELTEEINQRLLHRNENDHYVTMILGVFNMQTGELGLVQAGHPPPLITEHGEPVIFAGEGGVPLGLLKNPGYAAQVLHLAIGARLYLYSDGVTECRNKAGEEYGAKRLAQLMRNSREPLALDCQALALALSQWRGVNTKLEDDVTFVGIEYMSI